MKIVDYSLNGSFSGVYQLQANGVNTSGNDSPAGIPGRLDIVDGVMRATVLSTDAQTSLGHRSEIRAESNPVGEYWYTWEMLIPDTWASDIAMSVMQIHDTPDGGDNPRFPNFLLTVDGDSFVALVPSATLPTEGVNGTRVAVNKLVKGRWYALCLHVSWQTTTGGFIELLIDREPLYKRFSTPTHYADASGPYLKLGVYDYYHIGSFAEKTAYFRNVSIWSGNDGYQQVLGGLPRSKKSLLMP